MTNANEITFGIEIETHIAGTDATPIGGYHSHRTAAIDWLPAGWKAERDGSIRTPGGRRAAEFVSPKLKGEAGLLEAYNAVKAINERGARVNESCGVHVTVTFPANDAAALARLISLFAHFEDGIYATTGTKRRQTGFYSKGIKGYGEGKAGNKAKTEATKQATSGCRYHGLNLTHIARGHNRVEFRLFSGSTNAAKLVAWIRLALAMVEYSLKTDRAVSFENRAKNNTQFGDGDGQRTLGMLLCRLGWLKWIAWGYKGETYGEVIAEGLPSMKESTKLLRKLAKKYDAS